MSPPEQAGQQKEPLNDLSRLLKDYLYLLVPPPSLVRVIEVSGNENATVRELIPLFEKNAALRHFMLKLNFLADKIAQWRSEVPENVDYEAVILDRILSLLGKNPVRNIVACIAMNRALGANLPRKLRDPGLSIDYTTQLPFALAAEEYCNEKKVMHSDMAFNGGLLYDWMNTLLTRKKASVDQRVVVRDAFNEGFAIARVSYRLAQQMRRIRHHRFVFGGGLLVPIGKIPMSMIFSKELRERSWAKLVEDCAGHPRGRLAAMSTYEARRLPLRHLEVSALVASFGETFAPVEAAIAAVDHPYYLDAIDPGLAALAGLWSVARAAALMPEGRLSLSISQENFLQKSGLTLEAVKKVATEARSERVG